jgi:hypothetical protein
MSTETSEAEKNKKIESSFVSEDANQTPTPPVQSKPTGGFVEDPQKKQEKPTLSLMDIFLYQSKQQKEMNAKMTVLNEKMDVFIQMEKERLRLIEQESKVVDGGQRLRTITELTPSMKIEATTTPIQPTASQDSAPVPITVNDPKLLKIKEALKEFADSLEIDSNSSTMYYIIKIKKYLGTENFAKIASIIRALGGSYTSQGKASHFEISKAS